MECYRDTCRQWTNQGRDPEKRKKILSIDTAEYYLMPSVEGHENKDYHFELLIKALHFIPLKYAYPLYFNLLGIPMFKIGEAFGVSESRISQKSKKAQELIKEILKRKEWHRKLNKEPIPHKIKRFPIVSLKEAYKKLNLHISRKAAFKKTL